MLSDSNVRRINDQIERQLRDLRFADAGSPEALAILIQIKEMQTLLNPQPTRSDILKELAEAIRATPAPEETKEPSAADLLAEIVATFRRR